MRLETLKTKVGLLIEKAQSGGGGLPDWDDDSPIIASGQGSDKNSTWEITEKGTLRWKIVTDTTNNKTGFSSTNLYAILNNSPDYAKNAYKVRQAYVSDGFETVTLNCLPNCERVRIPVGVDKFSTVMIGLKEIDLSGVGMLNDYQCNNFYTLEKATLNPLWTTLNRDSFNNCVSLRIINLENITEFKSNCLSGTINLDEVVFNEGLISLASAAFQQSGIKKAVFRNSTDSLPTIANNTFNNCNLLRDIFVPWAEGAVANAPWGATNATIHYNSEV